VRNPVDEKLVVVCRDHSRLASNVSDNVSIATSVFPSNRDLSVARPAASRAWSRRPASIRTIVVLGDPSRRVAGFGAIAAAAVVPSRPGIAAHGFMTMR